MSRSYTVTALATAFLASICIVALCFIVDPYKIYPTVPGLSRGTSVDLFFLMRLHTPYEVERVQPSVLIMGNSRSATLPPQIIQKPGETAYNASLPGATLREIRRMVEHAHANNPLQQAVIGVDIQMFQGGASNKMVLDESDRYRKIDPDLSEKWRFRNQRLKDRWHSLLSVNAMMDVWRILSDRGRTSRAFRDDGTWDLDGRSKKPPRELYRNLVQKTYERSLNGISTSIEFDELNELLDFTERNQIQTTLLILPMQGLLMNTIEFADGWKQYRNWQHELVTRVAARGSDTKIYGLEDRPAIVLEAIETPDPLFRDGVHGTRRAGIEILTCLAGPCNPQYQPTLLDVSSIDAYLEQVDALRQQYALDYPTDIAEAREWLNLK